MYKLFSKSLIAAVAAAVLGTPLLASAETLEKEVSRTTYGITVAVNASSVRCSALGYGSLELKVDVIDLDWAAAFNHRQLGEGKPCMTAGVCGGSLTPAKLRAAGEGDIPTNLLVVHKEVATLDRARGTCTRELVEELSMELHGIEFQHHRSAPLAAVSATQCLRMYR